MTSKDAEESVQKQNAAGVNPDDLRILEALLFASDELMTASRLKAILPDNPDARKIRTMVGKINMQLQKERHPFEIVEIGGGYQFRTITYYHPWVRQIFKEKAVKKLSIQALECLAIIAYKQPLSKAEIEAIRGVVSDGAMKTLLEKRLVTVAGRSDKPGRPLLYATTQSFLKYFGLNKIEDLPRIEEFESIAREKMEDMSLDELNEPEEERNTAEAGAENKDETGEPDPGAEESAAKEMQNAGETDSSVFEVSVDESEQKEGATGEGESDTEEIYSPVDTGSEDCESEIIEDSDAADENMVTDKTQAMVRDDIIPPVSYEKNLVKSADDLQDVDMGKTKAFSDSVFDLPLPNIAKKDPEEDVRAEEAETIVIKTVPDAATEETGSKNENQENGKSQNEEVIDEEEEAFDLEDLSPAIEEVKPKDETAVDENPGQSEEVSDGEAEKIPDPEESSFTIEVSVDERDRKRPDAVEDDEEVSFEVKDSVDEAADEEGSPEKIGEVSGNRKKATGRKKKGGKKKGK